MSEKRWPSMKDFLMNLYGPEPFGKKLFLLLRNNAIKISSMKSCCGHPGEPGC
jgi:hypothetical protein